MMYIFKQTGLDYLDLGCQHKLVGLVQPGHAQVPFGELSKQQLQQPGQSLWDPIGQVTSKNVGLISKRGCPGCPVWMGQETMIASAGGGSRDSLAAASRAWSMLAMTSVMMWCSAGAYGSMLKIHQI